MSNAIQQIAEDMLSMWEEAVANPVKMIRIVINPGDETMLKAFYQYMLAIDNEEEDMVLVIECPFTSSGTFSKETLDYVATQIEYWNNSKKPEDIIFEHVDWQPDSSLADTENPASLLVGNLNRLTEAIVGGTDIKCSFIFDIDGTQDYNACQEWFRQAISLPFHKQMVWGLADVKGNEHFKELESQLPNDVKSIYPPIDMDGAMEQLAEQAANEDRSDPALSKFRLALIRLMNSVKKGDAAETDKYTKECLDMALANVKKDINWLSQFVTVYTILYTDSIRRHDMKTALYFSDKAIESARLGIGKLDPSLAYRLLGNSLLGKGSVLARQSQWEDAAHVYREGADTYAACNDYLMQAEALRMCGWCWEKKHEETLASECYIEGFRLADKLPADMIKISSYPLLLLALLNNTKRAEKISDEELDTVLNPILGKAWMDYLYEYKRKLGKYDGLAEQNMDGSGTIVH